MLSDMYLVFSAVTFLLTIGALIDVIIRPEGQVKHMPKIVWVLLIVFLPLIGSVLWFALGREYERRPDATSFAPRRARPHRSAPNHPGTAGMVPRARSTEEQLADLEREIEFYAKQAHAERLERDIDERREIE